MLDLDKLTPHEREIRAAIRAFLLLADDDDLRNELEISIEMEDDLRAACIREIIAENN